MKANELRIGNYITGIYEDDNDKERKVLCRVIALDETGEMIDYKIWVETFGQDSEEYFNEFEPITLTEEWLLWLGFESNPYQDRYEKGTFYIECDKTKGGLDLWVKGLPPMLTHVHQLQNLYFALTGEELILNK